VLNSLFTVLPSYDNILEEEHFLLAVDHYLVFEVSQLEPEERCTVRGQLQKEVGLGNAFQHLQSLLRTT